MPIKKSALKVLRQAKKVTWRNKKVKSDIDALIKRIRQAVGRKDTTKAQEWFKQLVKKVDQAARKGILKKNNANRKKSRLAKLISTLLKK